MRSSLWQPVSWQGYRQWDEPHSQFPCNKVQGCALNFLINTPDFPFPQLYLLLFPYCILHKAVLLLLAYVTLLYNFIAVHYILISTGVIVHMLQQWNKIIAVLSFTAVAMFFSAAFLSHLSFIVFNCMHCCSVTPAVVSLFCFFCLFLS